MDDETKRRLDKQHADFAALRLIVARIAARFWDEAETSAWLDRVIERMETRPDTTEETLALIRQALDDLAPHLAEAARNYRGPKGG